MRWIKGEELARRGDGRRNSGCRQDNRRKEIEENVFYLLVQRE